MCVIYVIQTHFKRNIDTRNEFSDLKLALNMYHSSFYGKKFLVMGHTSSVIWPTAAIMNVKIQLVSLNNYFPVGLCSFYTKGDLCIVS